MPKRHELSDMSAKSIMWVAILFIIAAIIMFIGFWAVFFNLRDSLEHNSKATAPKNIIAERKGPPPPLLEINPQISNKAYLAKQRRLLNSYGWIDKQQGLAKIPIEKAIEIISYEYR